MKSSASESVKNGYLNLEYFLSFQLEFETFRAKSLAEIADERWDYLPSLIPPPG